jgi:hypothetical protein
MRHTREAEYTDYVAARMDWLRRTAFLLCKDSQSADDLVQTAITRLYTRWGRARNAANLDAYTRTPLVRVFLAERTSAWSRHVTLDAAYQDSPAKDPDHDAGGWAYLSPSNYLGSDSVPAGWLDQADAAAQTCSRPNAGGALKCTTPPGGPMSAETKAILEKVASNVRWTWKPQGWYSFRFTHPLPAAAGTRR